MLLCITGGPFKPELEAFSAPDTLLRLMFKTSCNAAPLVMGIPIIDYLQTGLRGISYALVFSMIVFVEWENIGITIKNHRSNTLIYKTFNNSGRARCTARMEKQTLPRH